jgi:hypothetical protein
VPTFSVGGIGLDKLGVGEPLYLYAVLEGVQPTGTIAFKLYASSDTTCSAAPASSATVNVAGNGTYATGGGELGEPGPVLSAPAPGTYALVVEYSGDANNAAVAIVCGEWDVHVLAGTVLSIASQGPVEVGQPVSVTASLANTLDPTGTVTFQIYAPTSVYCEEPLLFSSTVPLAGTSATSGEFVPTATGKYVVTASYSGDANNFQTGIYCEVEGAPPDNVITVNPASPTIAASAPGPVRVGEPIAATASVSGGFNPTGTIVFKLFGPADTSCAGAPQSTVAAPLAGGSAASGLLATNAVGTYNFIASYGGDTLNAPVSTACGATTVRAGLAEPTIASTASPAQAGTIVDTARLNGAFEPTGAVAFTLYGPNDPRCQGTPFGVTAPLSGAVAQSGLLAVSTPGVYEFVASYSGDAANLAATTRCGEDPVSVAAPPARSHVRSARITQTASAVLVRLTCTPPPRTPCRGEESLSTRELLGRGGAVVGVSARGGSRRTSRVVVLGHVSYVIAAGRTATIRVPIDTLGRRLRARFRDLPARLTLTSTAPTGSAVVSSTDLVIGGRGGGRSGRGR